MKAMLSLELIGADQFDLLRGLRTTCNTLSPELGDRTVGKISSGVWVAQIKGRHLKFGLDRLFLPAKRDYSRANSRGSRGVFLWFVLESDRIYEVNERTSWKNSRRYFCAVDPQGCVYELDKQEVNEWLKEKELSG